MAAPPTKPDAKADDKATQDAIKKLKSWTQSLTKDQRAVMAKILTPEQKGQFDALEASASPPMADIKKFIGTITTKQATDLATQAKLTPQQLAAVFGLRQLVK